MDWWITFDQQAADYLPDLRIEKARKKRPSETASDYQLTLFPLF